MDFAKTERIFKLMMGFLIFFFFVLTSRECKCEETNPCVWKETCGQCIQEDPRCGWCSQEDFTHRKISRCDFIQKLEERNCTGLVYPGSIMSDNVDLDLSEKGTNPVSAIQMKPQKKTVQLRANSPETFTVEYRQVVDYPVDLYYLLDVSHSMKEHKENLREMGKEFANKIGTISSNFTVGVGSFLDKVAFSDDNNKITRFESPVFLHSESLSQNTIKFQMAVVSSVEKVGTSTGYGSVSSLVGILDAIMQAIVCKEVGWRPESKKLIVIATGNDFHYAGDGKLTGAIKPNDGKCHLNTDGNYDLQDYPSLSQINRKIKEHNITVIFAATENLLSAYSTLSSRLFGSVTGKLANKTDVMRLIKEQYEAMSTSVEMTDTAQGSNNIEITYNSSCLDGENKRRNVCKGLKPEDTVTFNVTLKFLSCPKLYNEIEQENVTIHPVGRSCSLIVDLKKICGCKCENSGSRFKDSKELCSGNGAYKCGVCICDNNTYGAECECYGIEGQTRQDNRECKRGKEERLCSDRGECRCGKCFCNGINEYPGAKYYGKYCECSNYSCYEVNSKICNGHGMCDCGKCNCDEGWSGPDCTCSNNTEKCLVDGNGDMCSGHGICYCGSCKCEDTYYGQFCEDCPSCPRKCEEYSACVRCILSRNDDEMREKDCEEECEMKEVILVDKVEVNDTLQEKACSIQDENGCHIFFKYEKYDNKSAVIHAQETIECPEPPDVVAIVAGTIGSIVLAGLLMLIIWKILTHVHDRREFAKFEQERRLAKWDRVQNPIFVEPTSTFENPVYERS